jgi:hypothetical protein
VPRCQFGKWKNSTAGLALLAHAYNPSFSGGTDQEDPGLKPPQRVHETLSEKYSMQRDTRKHNRPPKKRKDLIFKKRTGWEPKW